MSREIRYVLSDTPPVKVFAECNEYVPEGRYYREVVRGYEARLIDLSKGGAKLSAAQDIPTRESVRLRFSIEDLGIKFYVDGRACWSKKAEDGSSHLGCTLTTRLPDGLFDRLAAEGQLDRRFDPRFDEEIELSAYWELGGTQIPVTLRNYSESGFCVFAKHPIIAGQRLHLCVDEPKGWVVIASAEWQLEVPNGYVIGASYRNSSDFTRIEAAYQALMGASNTVDIPRSHWLSSLISSIPLSLPNLSRSNAT